MKKILENLRTENNLRFLSNVEITQKYIINSNKQYLNLSSNDYLGISSSPLQQEFIENIDFSSKYILGTPSSRLMTGNHQCYQSLEKKIAGLYGKEEALMLSCGFMLNSGALPSLTTADDYIIADKFVHASIIDGIRLCECRFTRFRHNDLSHLRKILESTECSGTIFVALESIYSMDGDTVPLREIVEMKKEFGFKIYLDEAHAFGVIGERGLGIAEREGLIDNIDYLVVTLGKAAASQGAFIVLDSLSKEILVNRMRTLIFSTALPPITLMWNEFVIERITKMKNEREHIAMLAKIMSCAMFELYGETIAQSHIIPILVGDNGKCLQLANELKESGFWVTAIRYPTVPKGSARLRISLTSSLTEEDINIFIKKLKKWKKN